MRVQARGQEEVRKEHRVDVMIKKRVKVREEDRVKNKIQITIKYKRF